MKLYTVEHQGETLVCLEIAAGVLARLPYATMNDLLREDELDRCEVLAEAMESSDLLDLGDVRVLAPIPEPMQDVICLGMNYQKHKTEAEQFDAQAFTRERGSAVYFSKRATHCPGPGDPIPGHFDIVDSLDYETELAVILGKDAVNVAEEDAFDYVFGYTLVNDVSARNLQTGHKQWYFGKGMDGFTPMGPWIVTADEIPFPPALRISSTVNGEPRQDSNTAFFINTISDVLEELTAGMTLLPATIIATGTPAGVGMGFDPPKFLKPGDVVECSIEGIGTIRNEVR